MAIAPETERPDAPTSDSDRNFDAQITREWLITNGRGGYASGTPVGVPTRRYHGLLIAAARPPLERWLLLSAVLERITVDGLTHELAAFEFDNVLHPKGYRYQVGFEAGNNPQTPWVRFDYAFDGVRASKQLALSRRDDTLQIVYHIEAPAGAEVRFDLMPFVAMRDFHATTRYFADGFPVHRMEDRTVVEAYPGGPRLWMGLGHRDGSSPAGFDASPNWWYGFVYREELHRGFGDREDLFVPGHFHLAGRGTLDLVFHASADFSGGAVERAPAVSMLEPPAMLDRHQSVEERLVEAADTFVVRRRCADGGDSATVIAGYHWFGDWGRDTFIALPGLLLETGRFAEARQVLATFAAALKDGLIPNRFSDYGEGCDYNSVDASLWFLHGATEYCRLSGDGAAWSEFLGASCRAVIEGFSKGTQFNIHVDGDGLVNCGDATTQLTWMDAKFGDIVFTPRHGKPVEINALWYHGLLAVADLSEAEDRASAERFRSMAERARSAFVAQFWNPARSCLFDVVRGSYRDESIRPNQIFAASLAHSPLDEAQRRAVLSAVTDHLLTPYGLRSLAPEDPKYRPRYEGNPFERDSAYHQGTVWGWLIGPYIEAYLRVHGATPQAKAAARALLAPLAAHLDEAGIGSVSEVFDGDSPHRPGGCIAQAWSVSELLRAWRMTAQATGG